MRGDRYNLQNENGDCLHATSYRINGKRRRCIPAGDGHSMTISNTRASNLLANTRSRLNSYQLGCGYLQTRTDTRQHLRITLWHESSHYHVRVTHWDSPTHVGWLEWDNAIETWGQAQRSFTQMAEKYGIKARGEGVEVNSKS